MEYVFIIVAVPLCIAITIYLFKRFAKKTYPKKIENLYVDIQKLESMGFKFTGDKYEGLFRGFYIYIFVTSNMKGNDQVMVMVATNTESGPFDFLKTFSTGYFKNTDGGACTYIGFRLFMKTLYDPVEGIQKKLDKLIDLLNEKTVTPYQIGSK